MSRSYKNRHLHNKAGFVNWVSYRSNKHDRTIANRILRHRNNQLIREFDLDKLEEIAHKLLREVSDVYNFDSDGLKYYSDYTYYRPTEGVIKYDKDDIRRFNGK